MKKFVIVYAYVVTDDTCTSAKNQKAALEKFQAVRPEAQVIDIWEVPKQPVHY